MTSERKKFIQSLIDYWVPSLGFSFLGTVNNVDTSDADSLQGSDPTALGDIPGLDDTTEWDLSEIDQSFKQTFPGFPWMESACDCGSEKTYGTSAGIHSNWCSTQEKK